MNKKILIGLIATIVILITGYFLFFNQSTSLEISSKSQTYSGDISNLVLSLENLPEGYEIVERGPRTLADVSEESIKMGWKEGYSIAFQKEDTLLDISYISLWNSRYPIENVSKPVNLTSINYSEEEYIVSELPSPNIGDVSKAYKIKSKEWWGKCILFFTR